MALCLYMHFSFCLERNDKNCNTEKQQNFLFAALIYLAKKTAIPTSFSHVTPENVSLSLYLIYTFLTSYA